MWFSSVNLILITTTVSVDNCQTPPDAITGADCKVSGTANDCPATTANAVAINSTITYTCSNANSYFEVAPASAADNQTVEVTCAASGTFEYPIEWPISCVEYTTCLNFGPLSPDIGVNYVPDRGGEYRNGDIAE